MSFADQVDVFYGRVTHSSAQIYVRVSSLVGGGEWSLTGQVRGPIAPGTRTLPTTVALKDLGQGATLLGSCSLPDPAFWTTQLPATYEVHVKLCRQGEVVEKFVHSLGIRFFGGSQRNFLWEAKRWVLRGVSSDAIDVEEIVDFRDNAGALIVKHPSESVLRRASESGVVVAVELAIGDLLQSLRTLTRWPAVAIVILPGPHGDDDELRAAAPNLLFAQRIDASAPSVLGDWAQAVFCDATETALIAAMAKSYAVPIVAERRLNGHYTLLEARRECDHLQRDLATVGDFAGYVIHCGGNSGGRTMEAE